MLKFSIITPTFNRLPMLKKAVESLNQQEWLAVEHIVVDGGSTDGTQDWVRALAQTILVRGPDCGVYDALNKGLALASGDIVGFLNSDDRLEPGAIAAAAAAFIAMPEAASVGGVAVIEGPRGEIERIDAPDELALAPEAIFLGRCAPNPRFFRRHAALATGSFDLSYRFVADRDWLARFVALDHRTIVLECVLYRFTQHKGSMTFDPMRRHLRAIRRDRLQLGERWRQAEGAQRDTRKAAARLEAKMRLAVGLDEFLAKQLGEGLRTVFALPAWGRILRVLLARDRSRLASPLFQGPKTADHSDQKS